MLRRYPMALALTVVVLAGCPGDEQVPPPNGGDTAKQQQAQGQQETPEACRLTMEPTAIAALGDKLSWVGRPGRVATAKLKPYGPNAEVMLNAAYDTAAAYDSGAVVARLRALEARGYTRMNLAPGGTTYLWVQKCGSQLHLFYISDSGKEGTRAPAWVDHPHNNPARVLVAFRDTTISGSKDSLIAAGLVDSLEADSAQADSTSGDVQFMAMQVTTVCARCKTGGWCTGL